MRVSRLQLLLVLMTVVVVGYGTWRWHQGLQPQAPLSAPARSVAETSPAPLVPASKPSTDPSETRDKANRLIAEVSRRYEALRVRQRRRMPDIEAPLGEARKHFEAGNYEPALLLAQEADAALQMKERPAAAPNRSADPSGDYQVAQGDTLWRIARDYSPVRRGAGWVTIWRANQTRIKDFDRIEVGWNLTIPSERRAYVMPFWKPPALASAPARRRRSDSEELARLLMAPAREVDLAELLRVVRAAEVDLEEVLESARATPVDLAELPRAAGIEEAVDLREVLRVVRARGHPVDLQELLGAVRPTLVLARLP